MGSQSPKPRRNIKSKYPKNFEKIRLGLNTGLLIDELNKEQRNEFREAVSTAISISIAETPPNDLVLLLIASKKAYREISKANWEEEAKNRALEAGLIETPAGLIAREAINFTEEKIGRLFQDRTTARFSIIKSILRG